MGACAPPIWFSLFRIVHRAGTAAQFVEVCRCMRTPSRVVGLLACLLASATPSATAADAWVGVYDRGFEIWSNVPAGATVHFGWSDANRDPHTVTSYDGQPFDSGLRMSGGFEVLFDGAPTWFRCELHSTLDEAGRCDGMCGFITDDRTVPSAPVVTSPSPGQVLDSTSVMLAGTAGGDVRWISYRESEEGDAWIAVTEGRWASVRSFLPGDHTVEFRAHDLAEHRSEPVTISFTIADDIAPAAPVFLEPADGAIVASPYVATVAVDEDTAYVSFVSQDAMVDRTVEVMGGTATTKIFAPQGIHQLTAVAVDDTENRSESTSIDLTVDTRAPTVQIEQPQVVSVSHGPPLIVGVAADDHAVASVAVMVIDRLRATIEELPASCSGCGTPNVSWELRAPLAPGRYELRAIATDLAGYRTETSTIHVVVI